MSSGEALEGARLKDCPFCGHGAKLFDRGGEYRFSVGCPDCSFQGTWFGSADTAVAWWNQRAQEGGSRELGIIVMRNAAVREAEEEGPLSAEQIGLIAARLLEGG